MTTSPVIPSPSVQHDAFDDSVRSYLSEHSALAVAEADGLRMTVPIALAGPAGSGPGAVAERVDGAWAVSGTLVTLPSGPQAGTSLTLFRTVGSPEIGALIVQGEQFTGEAPRAVSNVVIAENSIAGILSSDEAEELRLLVVLAASAAQSTAIDEMLDYALAELRRRKENRTGRWSDQAFKHETADILMRRDVASLHGERARDHLSEPADRKKFALLAVIESAEASAVMLAAFRRLAGERGDLDGIERAAAIGSRLELLNHVVGQGLHLRQWLFDAAVSAR